jgi:nucleotide-binding universal stress UspA family protein
MTQKNIVVGADFSETGDQAIRVGLEHLASGVAQGMYVVHVLAIKDGVLPAEEPEADPDAHTIAMVAESIAHRISAVAHLERLPYHPNLVRVEVRKGDARAALLAAARAHHADLIIVGTHGRQGINRLLAGSVAETLVRSAECSVLVARPVRHAVRRVEARADAHASAYTYEPARLEEAEDAARRADLPWRPTDEAPR